VAKVTTPAGNNKVVGQQKVWLKVIRMCILSPSETDTGRT